MAFDYGGGGGRTGLDGIDAAGGLFGGGRNLVPQVEPIEAALPLRVDCVELIEGSGGEGIILSVGGGTSPGMPRENILAMLEALGEFNDRRAANHG